MPITTHNGARMVHFQWENRFSIKCLVHCRRAFCAWPFCAFVLILASDSLPLFLEHRLLPSLSFTHKLRTSCWPFSNFLFNLTFEFTKITPANSVQLMQAFHVRLWQWGKHFIVTLTMHLIRRDLLSILSIGQEPPNSINWLV